MGDVRIDWGAFEGFEDRVERKLQLGLGKVAHRVRELTVRNLFSQDAVDTGNLAGSYTVVEGVLVFYVETGVEYAPFVEWGTTRMAARPHLMSARMTATPMLRAVVKAVLAEAIKG